MGVRYRRALLTLAAPNQKVPGEKSQSLFENAEGARGCVAAGDPVRPPRQKNPQPQHGQ